MMMEECPPDRTGREEWKNGRLSGAKSRYRGDVIIYLEFVYKVQTPDFMDRHYLIGNALND